MKECLFCMIVNKKLDTDIIYEDKKIIAFRDIEPQAPLHILLIPKLHFSTLNEITANDQELVGRLIYNATKLAKKEGIAEKGYRTVFNCNEWGGQTVFHRLDKSYQPKAGLALAWNNLYADGRLNQDTLHESLPVLGGSKWVITKWFRVSQGLNKV